MTVGFCAVDEAGEPPGKVQVQEEGLLMDRSLKLTVSGTQPSVTSATKLACGGRRLAQEVRQLLKLARTLVKLSRSLMEAADQVLELLTEGAMIKLLPPASWRQLKLCPNSWATTTRNKLALVVKSWIQW